MLKQLIEDSIKTAMAQDWSKAVKINQQILSITPDHIPTLNRLANAYKELGKITEALAIYQKVIQIDKYNSIAKKNIELLKQNSNPNQQNHRKINPSFIEEPGRTQIIPLVRLGDSSVVSTLKPGEEVILKAKKRLICIYTTDGDHVGALTDDVAFSLHRFLSAGYTYDCRIKSVEPNKVTIFLKETKRTNKLNETPTFSNN